MGLLGTRFRRVIILLVMVLSCSLGLAAAEKTSIVVDGLAADWAGRSILLADAQGDFRGGGFDIRYVRGFTNDRNLYLLIQAYGSIGEYVQVDLDIDIDRDGESDYMATFRANGGERGFGDFTGPGEVWDLMDGGCSAQGEVVELKMPLSLIGGVPEVLGVRIRIMNGVCCDEQWRCVEDTDDIVIPHLDEIEPTRADQYLQWRRMSLGGAASLPFVLADGQEALEGARGLALSADGKTAYVVAEFSGKLSAVDLDPASGAFGHATTLASNLYVTTDLAIDESAERIYVSRERGPTQGRNCLVVVPLSGGVPHVITEDLGQLTNVELSEDGKSAYVVSVSEGRVYRVSLPTGGARRLAVGMVGTQEPFAIAVNHAETLAYVATGPAGPGEYPAGDLLRIELRTGAKTVIARGAIQGGSGITLSADEKYALVTEFGWEGGCSGALSVIDIDPQSAHFGEKRILTSGLCGPHALVLDQSQTLLFFVEVDAGRLSVVRVALDRAF